MILDVFSRLQHKFWIHRTFPRILFQMKCSWSTSRTPGSFLASKGHLQVIDHSAHDMLLDGCIKQLFCFWGLFSTTVELLWPHISVPRQGFLREVSKTKKVKSWPRGPEIVPSGFQSHDLCLIGFLCIFMDSADWSASAPFWPFQILPFPLLRHHHSFLVYYNRWAEKLCLKHQGITRPGRLPIERRREFFFWLAGQYYCIQLVCLGQFSSALASCGSDRDAECGIQA